MCSFARSIWIVPLCFAAIEPSAPARGQPLSKSSQNGIRTNPSSQNRELSHSCSLEIDMYDSYGDGWNGFYIGLYSSSGSYIDSYTLSSGSSGSQCIGSDVSTNTCYTLEEYSEGTYDSEISFDFCGGTGFDADSYIEFCIDSDGDCSLSTTAGPTTPTPTVASTGCLTLYQYDDYGDGWNGNYFLLEDFSGAGLQSVTLSDGSYGEECLVVEASTCYTFALDVQGTWTSELSWDLCGETGLAYDDAVSFCIASDLSCTLSDANIYSTSSPFTTGGGDEETATSSTLATAVGGVTGGAALLVLALAVVFIRKRAAASKAAAAAAAATRPAAPAAPVSTSMPPAAPGAPYVAAAPPAAFAAGGVPEALPVNLTPLEGGGAGAAGDAPPPPAYASVWASLRGMSRRGMAQAAGAQGVPVAAAAPQPRAVPLAAAGAGDEPAAEAAVAVEVGADAVVVAEVVDAGAAAPLPPPRCARHNLENCALCRQALAWGGGGAVAAAAAAAAAAEGELRCARHNLRDCVLCQQAQSWAGGAAGGGVAVGGGCGVHGLLDCPTCSTDDD